MSHGNQQLTQLVPSSASPGGSATSSKQFYGESPNGKGSRSHELPVSGMHTHRSVLLHSASPWISWVVSWKAATALDLVTWFPSKQTEVQSPCPCCCTGAGRLSATPCATEGCFSKDEDLFSFFAAFESCMQRCEANTHPAAPPGTFSTAREEKGRSSRTCPTLPGGLAPGQRSAKSPPSRRLHLQISSPSPWQAKRGSLASP